MPCVGAFWGFPTQGTHLEVPATADAGAGEGEHGSQQPLQRQPGLRGRATEPPAARTRHQEEFGEGTVPVLLRQPACDTGLGWGMDTQTQPDGDWDTRVALC